MPSRFVDCEDIIWTVDGLLAANGITVLSGDPGEGKTCLALQLAHNVMNGTPFLRQHCYKGRVLFVCQDESPEDVKDKIQAMKVRCPSLVDLRYHVDTFSPLITYTCQQLLLASSGYSVLVVDSLSSINAGALNSSDDMSMCMSRLRKIARANNLAILLLHHLRKPSGDSFETTESRVAGSFAIRGSCDRMLSLYRQNGDVILATGKKFRGRKTFRKLRMTFDEQHLVFKLLEVVQNTYA